MEVDLGIHDQLIVSQSQCKRRKVSLDGVALDQIFGENEAALPTLQSTDYFTEPCLSELAIRELMSPGYCSCVQDFTVGRFGYGFVKFFGETDVRGLDLDRIVTFSRHEVVVYEDENYKPPVGEGLNKPAEVTLLLKIRSSKNCDVDSSREMVEKLRFRTERQGARFISFNPSNGEWKFSVQHFSRFGLMDDDEEDMIMDDVSPEVQDPVDMNGGDVSYIDEETALVNTTDLSHSLPAHLGLDPMKMKEMRMLMFPAEEEDVDDYHGGPSDRKPQFSKESSKSPFQHKYPRISPPLTRKTPLALIEYKHGSFGSDSPGSILLTQQNKGVLLKTTKAEGFKLDLRQQTPVSGSHSHNVVDAGLFMRRSFGVGWGPNGVLIHSGAPVGSKDSQSLSSIINLEKVAFDQVARDENKKFKEELVDLFFDSPLLLHKEISHETKEFGEGPFTLKLQRVVCDRVMLSDVCRSYIGIVERQLEVPGLSSASRVLLMHQAMIWELIKVLFSSRQLSGKSKSLEDEDEEDMIPDTRETVSDVDPEALPLIRRAEFSYWLQESVCHRVQEEVSSLNDSSDLQHMFLLLTGRQLDAAVELAASRGDVRLACLLSQAGGSMVNRSDVVRQLDLWRVNGLDFNFVETERIRVLELVAGNIHRALHDVDIDWKRFLGLLMWYQLPPETELPVLFRTYQRLLNEGKAPSPVPVYIDEGPVEVSLNWHAVKHFDLGYYLMLLHANQEIDFSALKTMFSAFASTNDPLDYHMIWHQRAVLEAIGAFSSNDLHVLDISFISQLLCLGQCHWAVYVALHMPHREDYPYLQAALIREILFQYCETWSSQDLQRQFIEDLGIPSEWLNEALATYFNYYSEFPKALEHFLECGKWQKAHTIFMTSVAHSLFLSEEHSEIWRLAASMEDHKSEIEDWDLGAGIYVTFYLLRSSLQEDNDTMNQEGSLENKNSDCADFISRLNNSLAVWTSRLPVEARVVYSKMAEEICNLLLSDSGGSSENEVQLSCYDTIFKAPIPEVTRAYHLQDAVSLFTSYLSEVAS
ncbi:PREDICTED: nuclear pore complex protein NUP96 [Nicotiana attenuata]|uniref:Nuclear pore complex protein nup96 n=1 Tax=Nicotiana attenuata TaxID=49451 RepID=A0A314L1Z1_NICAT|nr:PREDICTED: nuclear pore complex protein NUP96 [Nicotiana attenuata]OIT35661.1 nuclear pore complex protein nup96 [Nicotiana attenuata]